MSDMLARLHARATGSAQLLQTRTPFRFAADAMAAPVPPAPATPEPGPVATPTRPAPPAPAAEAAVPPVPPAPSPATAQPDLPSPVERQATPASPPIDLAAAAATSVTAMARMQAVPDALIAPPAPRAPGPHPVDRPAASDAGSDPDRGRPPARPVPTALADTDVTEGDALSAPPTSPRPETSRPATIPASPDPATPGPQERLVPASSDPATPRFQERLVPARPGPALPVEDAFLGTGHPPASPGRQSAPPRPDLPQEPADPFSEHPREAIASGRPALRTPAPLVTEVATPSPPMIEPDSPARTSLMQAAQDQTKAVPGGPRSGHRWPTSHDLPALAMPAPAAPAPAAMGRDATAAREAGGRNRSNTAADTPPAEMRVDIGRIEVVLPPAAPPPVVRRRPQPPAAALKPRRGSEP